MRKLQRSFAAALWLLSAAALPGVAQASPDLAKRAGCAVCHAASQKLVGPSWREVAIRYAGKADAPALLAARVRKGGQGVWGQVPMAPVNASTIGDAELKQLIAWVLKTPTR